jgi:hypothetical protein
MMPNKTDGVFFIGFVMSGLTLVAGYLWNQFVTAAVGGIFLTALVTLGVNRVMQKDIRKYEKANLTVKEVYGPIYSDLLTIKRNLTNDKDGFMLSDPHSGIKNWPEIYSGYRWYLIPEDKRGKLRSFFQAMGQHIGLPGKATTRITSVGETVAEREFGFKDFANILFRVKEDNGQLMDVAQGNGGWWWGLVFWHVKPSESLNRYGTLVEGVLENRGKGVIRVPADKTDEFIVMCWAGADKDSVISEAKKKRKELEENVDKLLTEIQTEIENWVKA